MIRVLQTKRIKLAAESNIYDKEERCETATVIQNNVLFLRFFVEIESVLLINIEVEGIY